MGDKIIKRSLGGVERTIDVGKFWFTKFYGQATGEDPLNSTQVTLSPERQFDWVVNMVYAGLRTSYKIAKVTEDFTKQDVENWIGEMENEDVAALIIEYATLTAQKPAQGEQ